MAKLTLGRWGEGKLMCGTLVKERTDRSYTVLRSGGAYGVLQRAQRMVLWRRVPCVLVQDATSACKVGQATKVRKPTVPLMCDGKPKLNRQI